MDDATVSNFDWFCDAIKIALTMERLAFIQETIKYDKHERVDYTQDPENIARLTKLWLAKRTELQHQKGT